MKKSSVLGAVGAGLATVALAASPAIAATPVNGNIVYAGVCGSRAVLWYSGHTVTSWGLATACTTPLYYAVRISTDGNLRYNTYVTSTDKTVKVSYGFNQAAVVTITFLNYGYKVSAAAKSY